MKVCVVGASGKLGQYIVAHALARGYEVVGVCREASVPKLKAFERRITIVPGSTSDPAVIKKGVEGCKAVLAVLFPHGTNKSSSRMVRAILASAGADVRLVFSCGWHVRFSAEDVYPPGFEFKVRIARVLGKLLRAVDISDQEEACRLVFESGRRWTVVRGCDLEEGDSEGLPVWAGHVGHPALADNLMRRTDFALFMVHAITAKELERKAPALVGRNSASSALHANSLPSPQGSVRPALSPGDHVYIPVFGGLPVVGRESGNE